jgi:chromosome segregation ATPase
MTDLRRATSRRREFSSESSVSPKYSTSYISSETYTRRREYSTDTGSTADYRSSYSTHSSSLPSGDYVSYKSRSTRTMATVSEDGHLSDSSPEHKPADLASQLRADRKRDSVTGTVDIATVSVKALQQEYAAITESKNRIEKTNERLMKELQTALENANKLDLTLKQKVVEWKRGAEKYEDELKRLKFDKERKAKEYEAKLTILQDKMEELKSTNDMLLDKTNRQLEREIRALQNDLQEAKARRAPLDDGTTDKVKFYEREIYLLEKEIERIEGEIKRSNMKLRELDNERHTLQKTAEKCQQGVQCLDDKMRQLAKLENDIDALDKEYRRLQEATAKLPEIEAEVTKMEDMISTLKRENRQLSSKAENLEGEKRSLEREVARLRNQTSSTTSSRYGSSSQSTSTPRDPVADENARKIDELTLQIKKIERDTKRQLEDLQIEYEKAQTEIQTLLNQLEKYRQRSEELDKLIAKERAENKQQTDITKRQTQQLEKQIEVMREELTKTQKAIQKKENDKLEMQLQVDEMKTKLEQTQSALTKAETQFKTLQTTLENADKELRKANKELEETKELLKENEEDLAMTNRFLEECKLESAVLKTNYENIVSDLQEELYDETSQKEYLLKVNSELETEIKMLQYFFEPLDDGPRDGPDYSRLIDDYLRQYRQNIESAIKEMAKMAASFKQNLRTLEELQTVATEILSNLEPDYKALAQPEIAALIEAMGLAGMSPKLKFSFLITLLGQRYVRSSRQFKHACSLQLSDALDISISLLFFSSVWCVLCAVVWSRG